MTERYIFLSLSVFSVRFVHSDLFFTLILPHYLLPHYLQPTLFLHGNRSLTLVLLCNTLLDERETSSIIWLMRCICQLDIIKTPESLLFTKILLMDFYTTKVKCKHLHRRLKSYTLSSTTNETHINLSGGRHTFGRKPTGHEFLASASDFEIRL